MAKNLETSPIEGDFKEKFTQIKAQMRFHFPENITSIGMERNGGEPTSFKISVNVGTPETTKEEISQKFNDLLPKEYKALSVTVEEAEFIPL